MPSWPTAVGGMLMAGYAATQAQKVGLDSPTALVATALKSLGSDTGYSPSSSGRAAGTGELSVLQGEVDRLHKLLADVVRGQKSNGYTVIHTGRGGWSFLILPAAVAGGAFYLYVKIRGVTVSDFFMVTNKSLQQFRDLVSQSMTQLWEEVRKQKDEFVRRIQTVGEQQQQMMSKQSQMDEKLESVQTDVNEIRGISENIETRVGQMDHTIKDMNTGVTRANEGIYLLCAMVADVSRRIGMDSSRLRTYVQSAPLETTDSNTGLRTLLEGFASGEQPTASAILTSATPSITEVTDDTDISLVAGDASGLGMRGAANRGLQDDVKVMYRRESTTLATTPSGRVLGSFWGGAGGLTGSTSANRSRQVANAH